VYKSIDPTPESWQIFNVSYIYCSNLMIYVLDVIFGVALQKSYSEVLLKFTVQNTACHLCLNIPEAASWTNPGYYY
jgi:hypothetical protein